MRASAASPELRGQTGNGARSGPHYNLNIIASGTTRIPTWTRRAGTWSSWTSGLALGGWLEQHPRRRPGP